MGWFSYFLSHNVILDSHLHGLACPMQFRHYLIEETRLEPICFELGSVEAEVNHCYFNMTQTVTLMNVKYQHVVVTDL